MITRKKSHIFNRGNTTSQQIDENDKKAAYEGFNKLYKTIIQDTKMNLNKQLIDDGNVKLQPYAGKTEYVNLLDKNTLVCSLLTENIDHKVSCYPNEIILEIRDAYNKTNPTKRIRNANTDIKGILSQLKKKIGKIGDTEDVYLTVFDRNKELVYREKYFETTKYLTRQNNMYKDYRSFGPEFKGTLCHQFYPRMLRLEEKYSNFANINLEYYGLHRNQLYKFYNNDEAILHYNNKYTDLIKNECNKLTHDDNAMFMIHKTFKNIYLIVLLQYFLTRADILQISIYITYNNHVYGIYINKTGPGHYIFYNSNGDNGYSFMINIDKDVRTLLRFTYPNVRRYENKQQQYTCPLCGVFVMEFIESMLNPSKSLEEKISYAIAKENRDDLIKKRKYEMLNRNIPSVRPGMERQKIVDDTDTLARLQKKIGPVIDSVNGARRVFEYDLVPGELYEVHSINSENNNLFNSQFSGIFKYIRPEIFTSIENGIEHRFPSAFFYKFDPHKRKIIRPVIDSDLDSDINDDDEIDSNIINNMELVPGELYEVHNIDNDKNLVNYQFSGIFKYIQPEIFTSIENGIEHRFPDAFFYKYEPEKKRKR